ncbi:MAG: toprim domain-containing protein [Sediminibacterium magnilacihabitans]|jgi:DNA primase|nr:toprim domain-containing protein [Sediminibacterium magnilacihabitans]PQV56122.1 DNA primase [Sediminibacterium magnilacihabitans]
MDIATIKEQLPMREVLQHYNLYPDKQNRLRCPFHDDSTPSLQVYYKTQTAYCFSSNCTTHGKSMDVIDFIMHMEKCSKHEAIEKAKALIGGDHQLQRLTRQAVLTKMFSYFKNAIHNSEPAREYLQSRCLDHTKIEVGYNAGQFHHGRRKDEALIKSCIEHGLLNDVGNKSRTGDTAYNIFGKCCIVFALKDSTGHVSGLYFRSTLNNKDQRHFYLKDRAGLYPKYPATDTKKLILTESIIDAATLLQIPAIAAQYSVLALYGTNGFTQEHQAAIQSLTELEEIIFWLNADQPGAQATRKHASTLQSLYTNVRISYVTMPAGEDINSMAQAHDNTGVFIDLLEQRTADFSFSIEKENNNTGEQKEKAKLFIERGAPKHTIKPVPSTPADELDITNPYKLRYESDAAHYYVQGGLPKTTDNMKIMLVIEEKSSTQKARNRIDLYEDKQVEKLCKEVGEKLSLPAAILQADLYRLTDLLERHIEKQLQQTKQPQQSLPVLTAREREALQQFASKPKLIKRLNELLGRAGIVGEERNRIFLLIIAVSHKTAETLHALIQGSSGSGKTRLLKQISDCMPPENVTRLTRLSDKVLYNFPENYFVNRLLCLEDMDGLSEEAEFALRELQSNGELNSATSIKLENGQITSGQKTVRGPVASVSCTTHGELYEDNMGRLFLIAVDESPEQTSRIIAYQNSVAAGEINKEDEEKAKQLIRDFIRLLQPQRVVNPFAAKIQLPPEAHKIRRLNDLFQGFVKMVTIINQYQRTRDAKGRLVTEIEDLETAIAVMFESIVLKVDELDGSLRQFYEALKSYLQKQHKDKYQTAEFSLREIRQALKISKTQVFRYVGDLMRLEYLQQCGGYGNKGFSYRISYWDHYQGMREKIKQHLDAQLQALKAGTLRNTSGTLQSA